MTRLLQLQRTTTICTCYKLSIGALVAPYHAPPAPPLVLVATVATGTAADWSRDMSL